MPADGFYEWQEVAGAARKQPYAVALASGQPMAFAGLWEGWRDSASGEVLRSFTILTTDANRHLAQLHHRMPVILDAAGRECWLDPAAAGPALQELLAPAPEALLEAWPVSRRVNSPFNEDATLVEPV